MSDPWVCHLETETMCDTTQTLKNIRVYSQVCIHLESIGIFMPAKPDLFFFFLLSKAESRTAFRESHIVQATTDDLLDSVMFITTTFTVQGQGIFDN